MYSLERQTQSRSFPLIGSASMITALIEKVSRRTSVSTDTSERVSPNFLLIDTFTNELVKAQLEKNLPLETERRQQLQETIKTQLEAALREHLRTPYHTDANEIHWDKYAAGQLHIFHRHYHEKDLRDHCQEAVDKNVGPKRARYEREKRQMDTLYTQHVLPELQDFSRLIPARANILSWEVQQAYSLRQDEEIFVGQKHGLVMPANLSVYPDGFSYVNLHQLVYIPRLRRILVTIDQFFTELSYDQHAHILNSWEKDALPKQSPTEELLMNTIVALPESTRLSPAFSVFMEVTKSLDKKAEKELDYKQKQQYSHAFVSDSKDTLHSCSAFLTHILLMEYQICLKFPQAVQTLSQRLQVAFEMAAHPLLSGKGFQYQASLDSYTRQFLQLWLNKNQEEVQSSTQLFSQLQEKSFVRQSRTGKLSTQVEQQRNNALIQLSRSYPSILNGFLSQAQCAAGSLGGLSKLQMRLQSPLASRILGGHNATFSEIQQLLGARAERFNRGVCVNPDCAIMSSLKEHFGDEIPQDKLPFVGECKLCIHCEFQYQANRSTDTSKDSSDSLKRFGNQTFSNSSAAAQEYLRIFGIQPNLLPTFFLAEEWVTH